MLVINELEVTANEKVIGIKLIKYGSLYYNKNPDEDAVAMLNPFFNAITEGFRMLLILMVRFWLVTFELAFRKEDIVTTFNCTEHVNEDLTFVG